MAAEFKLNQKTRKRIEKVLRYYDAEPDDAMVQLYVESAIEHEGSLNDALKLDEAEMKGEGFTG